MLIIQQQIYPMYGIFDLYHRLWFNILIDLSSLALSPIAVVELVVEWGPW